MAATTITARERSAFIVLSIIIFMYVLLRACIVPFVHDEAASLLWFVGPGEWLPYHAHWDAGNHYLSSGCGMVGERLFGEHRWAVRWASIAAFIPYAWAAWRTGQEIRSRIVRWCAWSALLLCPFVLDFFSLFRGYGIELAAWCWALSALFRYARTSSTAEQFGALTALIIANATMLALLPVWCVFIGLMVVLLLAKWPAMPPAVRTVQCASLMFLGALPLYPASRIAMVMNEKQLLYHGSTDGFIAVTVTSLSHYVIGSANDLVIAAVVVVVACTAIVALFGIRRERLGAPSPLVIVLGLLWCDVLLRVVLAHLLHVNFPEDRAGIHYVPLVLFAAAFALDTPAVSATRWRYAALALLWLPIRAISGVNADRTLLWPEQSVPDKFLEKVADLQARSSRPLVIGGYHQLPLAWQFNARYIGQVVPPLQTVAFPSGVYDLCVVDARFPPKSFPGYSVIDSANGPGLWLLQRIDPLRFFTVDTFTMADTTTDQEFLELAHPPLDALRSDGSVVDITIGLSCVTDVSDLRVVIEVTDSNGKSLHYQDIAPVIIHPEWRGELLHVLRTLPKCATATRAVIYVYDPAHRKITVLAPRVVFSSMPRQEDHQVSP